MRKGHKLLVGCLLAGAALAIGLVCCGRNGEKAELQTRLQESQTARQQAEQELKVQQERREALEDDFFIAAAVAFCCVLAALMLVGLLVWERHARRALGRILQMLARRNGHG